MTNDTARATRTGTLSAFLGRLRFPQLFILFAIFFLADLFVPDLLPFADEIILGLLTLMTGMWRDRRAPVKPPEKNVSPGASES